MHPLSASFAFHSTNDLNSSHFDNIPLNFLPNYAPNYVPTTVSCIVLCTVLCTELCTVYFVPYYVPNYVPMTSTSHSHTKRWPKDLSIRPLYSKLEKFAAPSPCVYDNAMLLRTCTKDRHLTKDWHRPSRWEELAEME